MGTHLSIANDTSVKLKYKNYNSSVVMWHLSRSDYFRCVVFFRFLCGEVISHASQSVTCCRWSINKFQSLSIVLNSQCYSQTTIRTYRCYAASADRLFVFILANDGGGVLGEYTIEIVSFIKVISVFDYFLGSPSNRQIVIQVLCYQRILRVMQFRQSPIRFEST